MFLFEKKGLFSLFAVSVGPKSYQLQGKALKNDMFLIVALFRQAI